MCVWSAACVLMASSGFLPSGYKQSSFHPSVSVSAAAMLTTPVQVVSDFLRCHGDVGDLTENVTPAGVRFQYRLINTQVLVFLKCLLPHGVRV